MVKDLATEILDDEWYEDVSNAVSYAMENLPESTNFEKAFDSILEYNIKRKVHEYIIENGTKTLKRKLNWKDKTINQAFTEYKDIIDTCDICTTFKSFTFHIAFGKDSGKLQNQLLIWKELTNTYYPNLKVFSKRDGDVYKVIIKRWNT